MIPLLYIAGNAGVTKLIQMKKHRLNVAFGKVDLISDSYTSI